MKKINSGKFGTIYATNNPKRVIKKIKYYTKEGKINIEKEIRIQKYIKENFGFAPEIFNVTWKDSYCYIEMQRCKITFKEYIKTNYDPEIYKEYIKEILKNINKMNKYFYIHGDLHLSNIMIGYDDKIFFIDYGHSYGTSKENRFYDFRNFFYKLMWPSNKELKNFLEKFVKTYDPDFDLRYVRMYKKIL